MKRVIYALMALCLTGCQGKAANGKATERIGHEAQMPATASPATQTEEAQFPFPEMPSTLRTPEARKDYLLRNYWTCFDFTNQALLDNRDMAEQGFVNFIALLSDGQTASELTSVAMKALCEAMVSHPAALEKMGKLSKDYLYNPNSPLYNEALYAHYLRALKSCTAPPTAERQRADYLIRLIERNRPGEAATDFTYYNKEGKRMTLAQTPVRGERMMLLFYDPECDECHELLTRMATDTRLSEAVRQGKLTVLAIYTEGDEEVWRAALPTMPAGWLVGTDRSVVKEKALYDLKAMPCLYLLDKQKRVLVKDGEYEGVMNYEL